MGLDWRMDIGLHGIWHCIGYWIALDNALRWVLHAMDIRCGLDVEYRVGHWIACCIGLHWMSHCVE